MNAQTFQWTFYSQSEEEIAAERFFVHLNLVGEQAAREQIISPHKAMLDEMRRLAPQWYKDMWGIKG